MDKWPEGQVDHADGGSSSSAARGRAPADLWHWQTDRRGSGRFGTPTVVHITQPPKMLPFWLYCWRSECPVYWHRDQTKTSEIQRWREAEDKTSSPWVLFTLSLMRGAAVGVGGSTKDWLMQCQQDITAAPPMSFASSVMFDLCVQTKKPQLRTLSVAAVS